MILSIKSADFVDGGIIPTTHTCDGNDVSPDLTWSAGPAGTTSFVLIMDDPDAPMGTWDHWLVFNLPPDFYHLPKGFKDLPAGTKQGLNSWKKTVYGGPCPPDREHRYFFKLYALDAMLGLDNGATKQGIMTAMKGHILAEAQLMGRYNRPSNAS